MSKEQLIIILDTIAFFLVTIDLYGKSRLIALREKIVEVKPEAKIPNKYLIGLRIIYVIGFMILINIMRTFIDDRWKITVPNLKDGHIIKLFAQSLISTQNRGYSF